MTQSRTEVLILNQQDVKRLLDIPDMLDALERAFVAFSAGKASVPPRVAARAERGLLGVMPGYLPGVALEAKIVSVFPANHEQGRPSHQGLIALFDEDDGTPLAIMDGIYVTAIRTGGGAAVSARALARKDSRVLTILGAGAQGHSHLATLPLVREFEEIRIASRNQQRANDLAAENPRAKVVENYCDAVTGADVVCCCTDALRRIHLPREHRSFKESRPRVSPRWGRCLSASGPDASPMMRLPSINPLGTPSKMRPRPGWCTTEL